MTNKYIEVVKKWLEGEIFSAEEMRANAADATEDAAKAGAAYGDDYEAVYAANAAWLADHDADSESVDYWIKRYEEIAND